MSFKNNCEACKASDSVKAIGSVSSTMIVGGSIYDSPTNRVLNLLSSVFPQNSYYLTYSIKCKSIQKPNINYIRLCNPILKNEITIIKPKFVIVLGAVAYKSLLWDFSLNTKGKPSMTSMSGSHIVKDGVIYFILDDLNTLSDNTILKQLKKFYAIISGKTTLTKTNYTVIDCIDHYKYLIDSANKRNLISIDIETSTKTPFIPEAEVLTIAFSTKVGESFVAPLSFRVGDYFKKWEYIPKLSSMEAIIWINKILKNDNLHKIFHNAQFDVGYLEAILGYRINNLEDTMVMQYLLNQGDRDRKDLKLLSKLYTDLGVYEHNIKQYRAEGEPFTVIPPEILMNYNMGDADATFRIYNILLNKLKEASLYNFYKDFMLPHMRSLIQINKDGVALNIMQTKKLKEDNEMEISLLASKLRELPVVRKFEDDVGRQFSPTSTNDIFAVVYNDEIKTEYEIPRKIIISKNGKPKKEGKKENLKINFSGFGLEPLLVSRKNQKTGKRDKTKSFSKEAIQTYLKSEFKDVEYLEAINTFNIDELPDNDDLIKFIKITSKMSTTSTQLSNHIRPFLDIWARTDGGRIHTSYDITGTGTGRLNSRDPNLQNLSRDGFVKECFGSRWGDEGILLESDYKQLELFIMAVLSGDRNFTYAFKNNIDLHTKVAAETVFKCSTEDVSKQMRTAAKCINFGIIYGLSAYSLAEDINISVEEAEDILNRYFNDYIGVHNYILTTQETARASGYITTVMGRRRYIDFSDVNAGNRQAVNTSIQSPASDVCLSWLSKLISYYSTLSERVGEEVAVVCGTVHDSIWVDCKKKYINYILKATKLIMENTGFSWVTLPLKVDIKYGGNLKDMTEWDGNSEVIL